MIQHASMLRLLTAFGFLILLPGCASSTVCGPPESLPPGVRFLDKSLVGRLGVTAVQARPTATGTLEVRAALQSCSKTPMQIEARTQFLDASQLPTESVTAFKRVYLPGNGSDAYTTSSSHGSPASYLIEIREGQ